MLKRWLLYLSSVILGLVVVGALLGALVLALLWPTLPSLDVLTDYQPKVPLRVVSAEGDLLGEFGEERRAIVTIKAVPDVMKQAILAAEDERFYQHGGVDYLSVARAALSNVATGSQQGAGTITMQVARNFFLTREKTVTRKLREVLLAWKIEANLTKDEILELYVNQIFLGQRAYGFAAASQIYFGRPLKDVTVAEAAMLAGLPKAPSAYNPVTNPKRAKTRQLYVLRRMHDLKFISDSDFQEAQTAPLAVRAGVRGRAAHACRRRSRKWRGRSYSTRMATTPTPRASPSGRPSAARTRNPPTSPCGAACIEYDRRHGYRGPEDYVSLPADPAEQEQVLESAFADALDSDNLDPAVVLEATANEVKAVLVQRGHRQRHRRRPQVRRAQPDRQVASDAAHPPRCRDSAVARTNKGRWGIGQVPQAESAFVAAQSSRWRDPGAGRRLRPRPQQVQSRDAGLSPAGLVASSRSSIPPRWKKASRPPP